MKPDYVTHNDLKTDRTGFMGYVQADYAALVEAFGEPGEGTTDGKTDALWTVLFTRKRVASIHNWKDGKSYLGEEGTPNEQITLWHVGGRQREVLRLVAEVLELQTEEVLHGYPLFKKTSH